LFRYRQGIIHFDAQIPDGAFDLCVPEQKLDSPEIFSAPIDKGNFVKQPLTLVPVGVITLKKQAINPLAQLFINTARESGKQRTKAKTGRRQVAYWHETAEPIIVANVGSLR
jgi:hypothetical protein